MTSELPLCLLADPIEKEGLDLLKSLSLRVEILSDKAKLKERIREASILIARTSTKVNEEILTLGKKLKLIAVPGTGFDHVDLVAAKKLGIKVMHSPEGNAISTAEFTLGLILACLRMIPEANSTLHAGGWDRKRFISEELAGKKVGIVGLGRVGSQVAKRLLAFDTEVLSYDPFILPERFNEFRVQPTSSLNELIESVSILTLHTPLTNLTRKMVNEKTLSHLKEGSILVNAARGELIEEPAVLNAIESGRLKAYAADVFEEEPLPRHHPFRGNSKILLSPHLGSQTLQAQVKVSIALSKQIAVFLSTGEVSGEVLQ